LFQSYKTDTVLHTSTSYWGGPGFKSRRGPTILTEVFCGFLQIVHANIGIIP